MTHERLPNDEATDGPEHTDDLPDAGHVQEFDNVQDSLAPPLFSDLDDGEFNA